MLKKDWPRTFSRTIVTGKKGKEIKRSLTFVPGVPVELTKNEVDALRFDIGVALQPIEFDEKSRPRIITDEVVGVDESLEPIIEPQSANR